MKKRSIVVSFVLALLLFGVSSVAQAFFFSFGFGGGGWGYPYYAWHRPYYSGWGYPGYRGLHYYRGYAYRPYYARYYRHYGPYLANAFRHGPGFGYPLTVSEEVAEAPKVVEK